MDISRQLKKAKEVFDDINTQWIDSDQIGVDVTLYFPPTYEECDVCQNSDWGNTAKFGGPMGAHLGSCPACGGTCNKEIEVTRDIKMRVYSTDAQGFSLKKFKKLGVSINVEDGDLFSIGHIADAKYIASANYAVFYSSTTSETGPLRYNLSSEIRPHGFGKDKFFFCTWKRA